MIKYMVKYIEFFNGVYLDRSLFKLGDLFFYILKKVVCVF